MDQKIIEAMEDLANKLASIKPPGVGFILKPLGNGSIEIYEVPIDRCDFFLDAEKVRKHYESKDQGEAHDHSDAEHRKEMHKLWTKSNHPLLGLNGKGIKFGIDNNDPILNINMVGDIDFSKIAFSEAKANHVNNFTKPKQNGR